MLRTLAVLLLLSVFTHTVQAGDIHVTIHVDGDYKPYSFSENGIAKGMYIDVLKTAFSRMKGFSVDLQPVPWRRGKQLMETGQGFALTPAFYHGHDWPYLYPYSLAFYTETIIAVCQEAVLASPRNRWPQDYTGLSIGNVAGFDGWGGDAFRALVRRGAIRYEEVEGSQRNVLKLAYGRLDCIMMEATAFDFVIRRLIEEGSYVPGKHLPFKKGATIGRDPVYIGYSKTAIDAGKYPFHADFRQALDSEIYKMRKSGEIETIMTAYGSAPP